MPVLILIACFLVAIQPRLSAWVLERRARAGVAHVGGGWMLVLGVYLTGIYGGYFGAAQGVILIALLAILVDDDLQRLNGLKNLITVVINSVSAILFIFLAPVAWAPAILLAIGSIVGGQLGAVVGRRLSPFALSAAIITVGTARGGAIAARLRGPDRPESTFDGRERPLHARSDVSLERSRSRRVRLGVRARGPRLFRCRATDPGACHRATRRRPRLRPWT